MRKLSFIFCLFVAMLFFSCNRGGQITRTDTPTSGLANIVVDECFAPIIQEEVDVFEALNPDAHIFPTYTSGGDAYDLFMKDSIQLVIGTRELTLNETQIVKNRNQTARTQKIAVDGIAIIVNKSNVDTLISVSDLKRIMTGEARSWKDLNPESTLGEIELGFDSPNSSTVLFIRDSICGGQQLGDNVKAKSASKISSEVDNSSPNQKVIDFVATTPNAMGVIGVNWISNPSDTTNLSFLDNIRVMSISNEAVATKNNSFKPYAAYLALEKYPLRRDIFVIISDVRGGLPSGFVTFVAGDAGQRIILKSGLLPATRPMRLVRINADL